MTFEHLGIDTQLTQELQNYNIKTPTQIQEKTIPLLLTGQDLIARSETGSGKTLCFALPILGKILSGKGVQSLIIVPTRELAKQIALEFQKFSRNKNIRTICVYGGTSLSNQITLLRRADIVVGTPGRLLDLMRRRNLDLSKIQSVVLDEADRMLDMGFIHDIETILQATPKTRQTMFFSATVPEEIIHLGRKFLSHPASVNVLPERTKEVLAQFYYTLRRNEKISYLVHSLKKEQIQLALIFCKTKHFTKTLARELSQNGIKAASLNGNMSQSQRERTIQDFKEGRFTTLVATDVAARGLHIDNVSHVYNFELPMDLDSYTHRIGRTARAGKEGKAISLVAEHEYDILQRITGFYKEKIKRLEKEDYPLLKVSIQDRPHFNRSRGRFSHRNNAEQSLQRFARYNS